MVLSGPKKTITVLFMSLFAVAAFAQTPKAKPGNAASKKVTVPKPTQVKSKPKSSALENDKCTPVKGRFPLNFDKAKVIDVISMFSSMGCMNFVLSENVSGNKEISFVSHGTVNLREALQGLSIALEQADLAMVPVGKFHKIIKRNNSSRDSVPVISSKAAAWHEGVVTMVYELKHTSRSVVDPLLKRLINRQGDVSAVGESILVITDEAANVRRLISLLERVDVPGASSQIHVIDLVYSEAQVIEKKIRDIFDATGGGRSASSRASRIRRGVDSAMSIQKIIADERTNKLIVVASDEAFERIKEVVGMLDLPPSSVSGQGQVHVYAMKNGDAEAAAKTLQAITKSTSSGKRDRRNKSDDENSLFEDEIKITSDKSTNSLVIVASPRDYKAILGVVHKLDRPRIRVFVEAAILDISIDDTDRFGINAFGIIPGIPFFGGETGTGIVGNPGGLALAKNVAAGMATGGAAGALSLGSFIQTLGFMGPTRKINGVKVPGVGAVLDMIQTSGRGDLLSTPHILTLDNQKAEFSVGTKVPVVKGTSTVGGGGASIPIQNIDFIDVKLELKITPHVNDENVIRLEIEQDVNDISASVELLGGSHPIISTKSLKTTIVAKDQQTVVMGGLISHKTIKTTKKIPFLGDIPLIGRLFKTTEMKTTRSNLILVLTPHIIRTDADHEKIFRRKMKERQEFAEMYYGSKITTFDPHLDYTKKKGPSSNLISYIEHELQRIENGGAGLPGEKMIVPGAIAPKWEIDIETDGGSGGVVPVAPEPAPTKKPSTVEGAVLGPSFIGPLPEKVKND